MGFTELLTIALVVLNATGYIHISWWLAFAPELLAVASYLGLGLLALAGIGIAMHGSRAQARNARRAATIRRKTIV